MIVGCSSCSTLTPSILSWPTMPSTWHPKWMATHRCSHQPMELKQSADHADANAKLLSSSPTLPGSWRPQRPCPQRGHQSGCRNLRQKGNRRDHKVKVRKVKSLTIHAWISFHAASPVFWHIFLGLGGSGGGGVIMFLSRASLYLLTGSWNCRHARDATFYEVLGTADKLVVLRF